MKIGIVVPPMLKTPPTHYGGLEVVAYDLCVALANAGEDVTLIAPKGSRAEGCKVIETIDAPERVDVNWLELELKHFDAYKGLLGQFDIVHDHSWFACPYLARVTEGFGTDMHLIHTHHGHLDWSPNNVKPGFGPICLTGISQYMQREYATQGWISKYVYNGIDTGKYPFQQEKENRFVFVGRISKLKQPNLAIDAAIAANTPIDVIGGSFVDDPTYLENIRKKCEMSGGLATLHLDASHEDKIRMVGKAKACLVPSNFSEPYGLVATEALCCGTPVIATDDGALSEIVLPKVGIICAGNAAFVDVVQGFEGDRFEPKDCRERAEYFSREKMAERYLKLYREVIKGPGW